MGMRERRGELAQPSACSNLLRAASPWPTLRSPFALFQGLGKLAQLFTKSPWAKKYDTMHGRRVAMHHSYRSAAGRRLWYQLTMSDISPSPLLPSASRSRQNNSPPACTRKKGEDGAADSRSFFRRCTYCKTPVPALSAGSQILVRQSHHKQSVATRILLYPPMAAFHVLMRRWPNVSCAYIGAYLGYLATHTIT